MAVSVSAEESAAASLGEINKRRWSFKSIVASS